jgi:centrosomal protein CEP41
MLSFVSHEYRTPLNCIIYMLEEVISKKSLESQTHLIKYSLSNAKYLLCLSNDLLDWAQIK